MVAFAAFAACAAAAPAAGWWLVDDCWLHTALLGLALLSSIFWRSYRSAIEISIRCGEVLGHQTLHHLASRDLSSLP